MRISRKHIYSCIFSLTVLTLATKTLKSESGKSGPAQWTSAGQDQADSRNQPNENTINASNAVNLLPKWAFTTGADVSATPAVADDAIYFPDWAGNLYAVNKNDGTLIWSRRISDYDNYGGSLSRVTPAIHGDDLILGDIENATLAHTGASVMAVNRQTGTLHWITRVDTHLAAIITGSAVVAGDTAYVGVSSTEESLATQADYPCCSFRGSMVALNANTGQIIWQTYVMPDNHGQPDGYSGGAIWQPPAIDLRRGSLYVGTGNNYEVPESVKACLTPDPMKVGCLDPTDYYDTAMALDLQTGQIKWTKRLQGIDIWTVACIRNPNPVACPLPASPDYDLGGSGPNLLPNMVGFGQKSGMYWALRPDTGDVIWSSMVGPGASLGGIEWGTATDGRRIYVAVTNSGNKPYPLVNGTSITWGAWSALDVGTGRILWQTADPAQGLALGSVSVANGVLYAPSVSGSMLALDVSTGRILWTFASGGSVVDGPSIADGIVYWGSGYKKAPKGIPNNKVIAFTVANSNANGGQSRHNVR